MTTTLTSPRNTTAKYSAEENDSATLANGGETSVITRQLRNPPSAEPMMATPSALATWPFLFRA